MKSILRTSITSMLVLGLLISLSGSVAYAQLFPGYQSGVQVANLEGSDATITITGYSIQ